MSSRPVSKVISGSVQHDGAGVKLLRVLTLSTVKEFDPFLMLDVFNSTDPDDYIKGFPWHPHRGIETITYLINGRIEHGDSLGNKGTIEDGCCQWMTAGSGIIHKEMPKPSKKMFGFQLWLNLPAKDKMCTPMYHDITREMVPEIKEEGCTVKIIAGRYKNVSGVFKGDYVKTNILDVDMSKNSDWSFETNDKSTVFVYIFEGSGCFDEKNNNYIAEKNAVLFGSGRELRVHSGDNGIRFIVFTGNPLEEPVAWGGPVVMNTKEELENAFKEIDNGNFIKTGNQNKYDLNL
ncbi:pirin family protein [Clostridium tyrobutyricum]|uniref:pirin family protein n=1 Tax=Clostridium tyrobutyricum TaxID=1519 RepID=UPI001C37F67A|nr:pirin family protein [Clostridium tyrobutyricum]MBV4416635.1 pirin family protein [Clostridium tyrobutyricum]MBV4421282.1 pirin family protein [Clostridium tyrobutyricum]